MKINKLGNGTEFTLVPEGRLDTLTAPQFRECIESCATETSKITLDLAQLTYLSSIGLSLILSLKKKLGSSGTLRIVNAKGLVREVFEISGFADLLVN
ncbi:MAG: anti-sigma factor antagonist [Bacteroidia bacterium]|nr:anti-sigma factor antagonist [Bacteroidia bacterium]